VPLLSLRAAISLHGVLADIGAASEARARLEDALSALPDGCALLPEVIQANALLI
jgi:hypothetical protein